MKSKLVSVCMTLLLVFAIPLMVSAQHFNSEEYGSLTVTIQDQGKPVEGAEFAVYYVATVDVNSENNLVYRYADNFENCGVELDNTSLINSLDTFVSQNAAAASEIVTNAEGKAALNSIPLGLYLVKQTNSVAGYAPCDSFLVKVPYKEGDTFVYNVQAAPKTDIERLVDVTVKKVWNTDQSTKTADKVTVQLLKDGNVIETATLNDANGWKVVFEDMPESDGYSVVEINVPNGFTPTYSHKDYEFTVTNTASLIETGQLVWPVPILAMAGLVFITLGAVTLRRQEACDE